MNLSMHKITSLLLLSALVVAPNITAAQDTSESQAGTAAGPQASVQASNSGGFGLTTKIIVASAVIGGLVAVVLEAATDDSIPADGTGITGTGTTGTGTTGTGTTPTTTTTSTSTSTSTSSGTS